jgi:hypothetical protein
VLKEGLKFSSYYYLKRKKISWRKLAFVILTKMGNNTCNQMVIGMESVGFETSNSFIRRKVPAIA